MSGIVVGIDGSGNSQRALEWAVKEAAALHAGLTVLAVHQVAANHWTGNPLIYPEDLPEQEKARQAAEEAVNKAVSQAGGAKPASVTVRAVSGLAARELVRGVQGRRSGCRRVTRGRRVRQPADGLGELAGREPRVLPCCRRPELAGQSPGRPGTLLSRGHRVRRGGPGALVQRGGPGSALAAQDQAHRVEHGGILDGGRHRCVVPVGDAAHGLPQDLAGPGLGQSGDDVDLPQCGYGADLVADQLRRVRRAAGPDRYRRPP